MTTDSLTDELADQVEVLLEIGKAWSLRIDPDESPDDRRLLIRVHGQVLDELRARGFDVRATIARVGPDELDDDGMPLPPGEYLAICRDPLA